MEGSGEREGGFHSLTDSDRLRETGKAVNRKTQNRKAENRIFGTEWEERAPEQPAENGEKNGTLQ